MLPNKRKAKQSLIYVGDISLLQQFVLKCHSNEIGLNRKVVRTKPVSVGT